MKDCRNCLAFEEKEKDGHMKPYCDMYGMFLKSLDFPCEKTKVKKIVLQLKNALKETQSLKRAFITKEILDDDVFISKLDFIELTIIDALSEKS